MDNSGRPLETEMKSNFFICNNCNWIGELHELEKCTLDPEDVEYNRCPSCGDEVEDYL